MTVECNQLEPRKSGDWITSLWDEKTTAAALGLKNHKTLAVWRSTKRHPSLRSYKIGRNVRYDPQDVEQFIRDQAV